MRHEVYRRVYRRKDPPRRSFLTSSRLLGSIIGAGVIVGIGSLAFDGGATTAPLLALASGCNVKGNISIDTGERIYHVPGQKFFNSTKIRSEYGERWFCSEAEARKAGWRKARR